MDNFNENYPISAEMGFDDAEVAVRKEFLEFTEADVSLLKELHVGLETQRNPFSEAFYRHLQHFPQLRSLLDTPERLERLKHSQSVYFSQLTEGEYGLKYVENRLHVGVVHQRVGLTPQWYIGAYRKYLHELMPILYHLMGGECRKVYCHLQRAAQDRFFRYGTGTRHLFSCRTSGDFPGKEI